MTPISQNLNSAARLVRLAASKLLTVMLALLLLTLLSAALELGRAHAQTAKANWDCLPKSIGGAGSEYRVDSSDGWGMWISWSCPVKRADGTWTKVSQSFASLYSVKADVTTTALAGAAVKDQPDALRFVNQLVSAGTVVPKIGSAEETNLARLHKAARAYADANLAAAVVLPTEPPPVVVPPVVVPPVVKTYVVAANGTAKTRQWYPFAAGARTSTSGGGSVTIAGTACKPDVASVTEGAVLYAAFGPSFRVDRVTVCVAQ